MNVHPLFMQMRVGGKEISSADERWIPVINPATGEVIDQVPEGTLHEVDEAVSAAQAAFDSWGKKTVRERGMILHRAAGNVREQHQELARLLTMEQGKPLRDAVDEIRGFANILEFFAGISGAMNGDFIALGSLGDALVKREPIGVCGAIIPWNMPAIIMGWKVAPALLAGNTLVFKPSSSAPLTCLSLASLLELSGLPPGVLNVVTGKGEVVGEGIARHPAVRKLSFTGERATGYRIQELARSQLKDLSLELGGSDPMIVWKDADIGKAVSGVIKGRFYNAGQTCTAVKRLYVHHDIAKEFVVRLKNKVEAIRVGNGLDPGSDMGPLSGKPQLDNVISFVNTVEKKGQGTILTGGNVMTGGTHGKGFFYAPTLVTDTTPECILLQQEVFGPVLPVVPVNDLETAIAKANSTPYGLGASIWTNDLSVVHEVFSSVAAGMVWVNRHLTIPPEIPFGGVKESGIGRENGISAYHSYTRTKSLLLNW
ncbi:MAG TPA: aldehyde dehydrogenase family protein [Methanoregulaceae archaeon]|jgi:succinate-semialdehyde dehydrogenase/glutarate-semialdehyde dehydrogenase|nr:aldehyde dehydrogenase [Burkholderiaceae bacterium]HNB02657.1 aldehyde dehydrogenase family protein [Methanoregulaceae archaeon]HNO07327.1 aldehyde dehydrogenase family protein [Methanoregulaceae archaeon]HNW80324.1 aldehyde dehydrogenase family protein [Methanoregulaceae archaeon]HOU79846.1 aldehyde dehydrogenase family protein [Methanoregulaceae archaeon]